MADRTSAHIFGRIFELLAENPSSDHKELAERIYEMTEEYDFADVQMDCDAALVALEIDLDVPPEFRHT